MTNLPYRPTRYHLHVPLAFKSSDGLTTGRCENVSESGLLANFDQFLDMWTIGELTLLVNDYYLSIQAKVVREHGRAYGMSFLINNDNDRRTVRIMVDYASAHMAPGEQVAEDL